VNRAREEAEIRVLIGEIAEAWRRAYGARYQTDATFTNVFSDFYVGLRSSIAAIRKSFAAFSRTQP
jgi:hypothetical protein